MRKRLTRFLLSCCVLMVLMALSVFAANSNLPFTDVKTTDWFYEGVQYVYENEMMNGTSETTFAPETPANRAMIVTILYRKEKSPAVSGSGFPDVPTGQYYSDAAVWAAKNGIVTGYDNGKFGPDDPVTREQLAAILYRYANFKKYDTTVRADLGKFADAKAVSDYASDAMAWANAAGLITGTDLGKLEPTGKATRSQTASILTRFCKTVKEKTVAVGGGSIISGGGTTPFTPAANNLTISTPKTVTGGTYDDVTITAAVSDGDVTLDGVTIKGKLLVKGGGTNSIHLIDCDVSTIQAEKIGGETPRIVLQNTPVETIEVNKPAIIETVGESDIEKVTAKDSVTLLGESRVETIEVPATTSRKPVIDVQGGSVGTVEINKAAEVKSSTGSGTVETVEANAAVTVDSEAVQALTVNEPVTVTITGETPIAVSVETTQPVRIDAEDAPVEVVTTQTTGVNVQVNEQKVSHAHKWTKTGHTDPTCAAEGCDIYVCSGAGTCDLDNTKIEPIQKLPHTEVIDEAVAATCETDGKTEGKHCSVCGGVIVAQQTVPALGHAYGTASYEWTEVAGGYTCTATHTCTRDESHVETETVTAVYAETIAPGCTTVGEGTYTATFTKAGFDEKTKTVTIPALGHDLTPHAANAATCEDAGNSAYWSCDCGKYFSDADAKSEIAADSWIIPMLGHAYGTASYEWTEVTGGYTCTATRVCANDEDHVETETVTAAYEEVSAATCEDKGQGKYTATFTNESFATQTKTVEIDELGHDWASAWSSDGTQHWHECTREGCTATNDAADHVPGAAATETTAQTCTVCGYEIAPALGHICADHLTPHAANAATCEAAGNSAYWSCDCGKYFSDADAKSEIAADSWIIPMLGHAYGTASYEWTEVTGGYTCTATRVCANDEDHVETETVTAAYEEVSAATCEDKGQGKYTATFTNESFAMQTKTVEIDALGHAWATEWRSDTTQHWHVCTREGCSAKNGVADHIPGDAATETTAQTCTVCGYVIVSPLDHVCADHLTPHTANAATCEDAGNSAYWSCECGKYYSDEDATSEIGKDSWVIPALGHDLTPHAANAATCEDAGNSAYWSCDCGKYFSDENAETEIEADSWIIPALGHDLTPHAANAATCEDAGNSAYWSCDCGKYFSDENAETEIEADSWILPMLGHAYGTPTYEWAAVEGGYACTAKRVCSHDASHVETETVTVEDKDMATTVAPKCEPSVKNVALGKTATGDYGECANMFDGDMGTNVWASWKSGGEIIVDLGKTHKISGFGLFNYQWAYQYAICASWTFSVSEDGENWTKVGSRDLAQDPATITAGGYDAAHNGDLWYPEEAVKARYVKLVVDDVYVGGHTSDTKVMILYEFAIYGTMDGNGEGTYTATFTNSAFTEQTKTVVIPPVAHTEIPIDATDEYTAGTKCAVCGEILKAPQKKESGYCFVLSVASKEGAAQARILKLETGEVVTVDIGTAEESEIVYFATGTGAASANALTDTEDGDFIRIGKYYEYTVLEDGSFAFGNGADVVNKAGALTSSSITIASAGASTVTVDGVDATATADTVYKKHTLYMDLYYMLSGEAWENTVKKVESTTYSGNSKLPALTAQTYTLVLKDGNGKITKMYSVTPDLYQGVGDSASWAWFIGYGEEDPTLGKSVLFSQDGSVKKLYLKDFSKYYADIGKYSDSVSKRVEWMIAAQNAIGGAFVNELRACKYEPDYLNKAPMSSTYYKGTVKAYDAATKCITIHLTNSLGINATAGTVTTNNVYDFDKTMYARTNSVTPRIADATNNYSYTLPAVGDTVLISYENGNGTQTDSAGHTNIASGTQIWQGILILEHHVCADHLTPHTANAATCEDAGNSAYWSCECGKYYSDEDATTEITANSWVLPALNHSWASVWSSDGTQHWHECTREGCNAKNDTAAHTPGDAATETTAQTCTVCGYEIAPATGHLCINHLTAHPAVAATCENPGSSAYWSCTCGEYYSDAAATDKIEENEWVIGALGHAWATAWSSDTTQHWHECTREGCNAKNGVADHVPGAAATETTAQTCEVCGYVIASPLDHTCASHLTAHPAVAATCENAGNSAYWSCTCGKYFSDENAATEAGKDSWVIPALGHDWDDATYEWDTTADGYTCMAERVCKRDGSHKESETVSAIYAVTAAATCEEKGEGTYTATFKNSAFTQQVKDEEIPALGHEYGEVTYLWEETDGGYTCTATRVCARNDKHVDSETVTAALATTVAPKCKLDKNFETTNVALGKKATGDYGECANMFDGNMGTNVWTSWKPNGAIIVDLGTTHKISGFGVFNYQYAYQYAICASWTFYVSDDGENWTKVGSRSLAQEPASIPAGGYDAAHNGDLWYPEEAAEGRYVKLVVDDVYVGGHTSATKVMILYEFAIYGAPSDNGKGTYTATFTKEGFEVQTKDVILPALEHVEQPIAATDTMTAGVECAICHKVLQAQQAKTGYCFALSSTSTADSAQVRFLELDTGEVRKVNVALKDNGGQLYYAKNDGSASATALTNLSGADKRIGQYYSYRILDDGTYVFNDGANVVNANGGLSGYKSVTLPAGAASVTVGGEAHNCASDFAYTVYTLYLDGFCQEAGGTTAAWKNEVKKVKKTVYSGTTNPSSVTRWMLALMDESGNVTKLYLVDNSTYQTQQSGATWAWYVGKGDVDPELGQSYLFAMSGNVEKIYVQDGGTNETDYNAKPMTAAINRLENSLNELGVAFTNTMRTNTQDSRLLHTASLGKFFYVGEVSEYDPATMHLVINQSSYIELTADGTVSASYKARVTNPTQGASGKFAAYARVNDVKPRIVDMTSGDFGNAAPKVGDLVMVSFANATGTEKDSAGNSNVASGTKLWQGIAIIKRGITVDTAEALPYNGEEQTAQLVVRDSAGRVLTEGTDYTVTDATATVTGNYTATVTATGSYSGSVQANWSISPAVLTVKAFNQKMTAGNEAPALTYSITGFVGGDTAAVVTGEPALSVDDYSVGAHTITVQLGTLEAANYTFNLVNGSLTVREAGASDLETDAAVLYEFVASSSFANDKTKLGTNSTQGWAMRSKINGSDNTFYAMSIYNNRDSAGKGLPEGETMRIDLLEAPAIDTEEYPTVQLVFEYGYCDTTSDLKISAIDHFEVEVSTDGGANWTLVPNALRSATLLGSFETNTDFRDSGYYYEVTTNNLAAGLAEGSTITNIRVRPYGRFQEHYGATRIANLTLLGSKQPLADIAETDTTAVDEETLRAIMVDRVHQYATIEWTSDEEAYGYNYSASTGEQFTIRYLAGVKHRGPIYSRPSHATLQRLQDAIVDGEYVGGLTDEDAAGMDCMTFVMNGVFAISTSQAWQGYKTLCDTNNLPILAPLTNDDLISDVLVLKDQFTEEEVFAAYAHTHPGDYITSFPGSVHIRAVTGEPIVVYKEDGSIDPKKSMVIITDVIGNTYIRAKKNSTGEEVLFEESAASNYSNFATRHPGYTFLSIETCRIDYAFSFRTLYDKNYLPYTLSVYEDERVENEHAQIVVSKGKTDLTQEGFAVALESNYHIVGLTATLTDKTTGQTYFTETLHPVFQTFSTVYENETLSNMLVNDLVSAHEYELTLTLQAGPITTVGGEEPSQVVFSRTFTK